MASGGAIGNNQFGFGLGGFTNLHTFEFSKNNNPTGSFGVPTSFSGQGSSNSSSSTASAPLFGTTSSMLGTTNPFSSGGQPTNSWTQSPFGVRPNGGNSFTTSQLGTSSCSTGQTSNSWTTTPSGIAPFSVRPTTTPPFGIGPFSTGQTSSSHTTSPFTTAPPNPFNQPNNSWTTSPFGQTSSSVTTSPFTTGPPNPFNKTNTPPTPLPFTTGPPNPFSKPNAPSTTSPFTLGPPNPFSKTNIPSTTTPFSPAPPNPYQTNKSPTTTPFSPAPPNPFQTNKSPTTSPFSPAPPNPFQPNKSPTTSPFSPAPFTFPQPSNSLTTSPTRFPFSGTSIQGTRQKAYETTDFEEQDGKSYKIPSISAMPCYINKSHEELRLEDYTSTGKAGIASTTTTTTTPNIRPIFPPQPVITPFSTPSFVPPIAPQSVITPFPKFDNPFSTTVPKSTTTTTTTPNIQPVITPFSTPSFVPPTSTTYITPSIPVPAPFPKFNYPFPTFQTISTPSPNSTTGVLQDSTAVPVTSIPPETVSESKSGSVTENNNQEQHHEYPCPVSPIIKPFQYGISCLPVKYENPKPAQKMPMVNVRNLSMGRRRLPIEKYKPIEDVKRVPFFEDLPAGIYTKGAGLIPRENPRSWVVLSCEEQRLETESVSEDASRRMCSQVDECVLKTQQDTGAIISNDGKDPSILAMIPKLRSPDYYMEPSTDDLAANELKRPGFCSKVKDFVIGRRNYGSIKFLGETDLRNLDVESVIQFANREVEVYKDEKDKPPVGQGLNKGAEITLLNIKCIDKSTGMHYTDGPRVDKFKELLMSKAMKQGSEFISYDPVKGEWRFKVKHF